MIDRVIDSVVWYILTYTKTTVLLYAAIGVVTLDHFVVDFPQSIFGLLVAVQLGLWFIETLRSNNG